MSTGKWVWHVRWHHAPVMISWLITSVRVSGTPITVALVHPLVNNGCPLTFLDISSVQCFLFVRESATQCSKWTMDSCGWTLVDNGYLHTDSGVGLLTRMTAILFLSIVYHWSLFIHQNVPINYSHKNSCKILPVDKQSTQMQKTICQTMASHTNRGVNLLRMSMLMFL